MTHKLRSFGCAFLVGAAFAAFVGCGSATPLKAATEPPAASSYVVTVPPSASQTSTESSVASEATSDSNAPIATTNALDQPFAGLVTADAIEAVETIFDSTYSIAPDKITVVRISVGDLAAITGVIVPDSESSEAIAVAFATGELTDIYAKTPPGAEPVTGTTAYTIITAGGIVLGGGLYKADLTEGFERASQGQAVLSELTS